MNTESWICTICVIVCLLSVVWVMHLHQNILRNNRELVDCILDHAGWCGEEEP